MTELELDVLTRIAFGEEEPGDQERLRAILDQHPDAQKELDDLRLLCGDLGVLAAVPQPQIQFGRVRQAIESASVRPKRAFPALSLVVGLAGAAAAFALFTFVNRPATVAVPNPATVAMNDQASAVAPRSVATDEPTENVDTLVQDMMATEFTSAPTSVATGAAKARAVRRSPRPATVRRKAAPAFTPQVAEAAKSASPIEAVAFANSALADQDTHAIVVVTNRADPETGAARAFESTDSSSIEFRG